MTGRGEATNCKGRERQQPRWDRPWLSSPGLRSGPPAVLHVWTPLAFCARPHILLHACGDSGQRSLSPNPSLGPLLGPWATHKDTNTVLVFCLQADSTFGVCPPSSGQRGPAHSLTVPSQDRANIQKGGLATITHHTHTLGLRQACTWCLSHLP
jgi:hypothetical protein